MRRSDLTTTHSLLSCDVLHTSVGAPRRLLGNMGVALLELGQSRDALRYYRRAMAVDPHNLNARFNAG